jgi:hypothetical protein
MRVIAKKKRKLFFLQSTHPILYDFPYVRVYICVYMFMYPIGYMLHACKLENFTFH